MIKERGEINSDRRNIFKRKRKAKRIWVGEEKGDGKEKGRDKSKSES